MKKIKFFIISMLIIISMFCGCTNKDEQINTDHVLFFNPSDVGLNEASVTSFTTGYIENSEQQSEVYLLYDYPKYADEFFHETYIVIKTGDNTILKNLQDDNSMGRYSDSFYLCDVDGDGLDELFLHSTVGMTGGAGQYISQILKVKNGIVEQIFYSAPGNNFDTGFSSDYLPDKKLLIYNSATGFNMEVDISERYSEDFFDSHGKGNLDEITLDPFCNFFPVDIDFDGQYELLCRQYASLYGHADGIGSAISILKYDADAEKFITISSDFECFE